MPRSRTVAIAGLVTLAGLASPAAVAAHGPVPSAPPTLLNLLLGWHFEPTVAVPLVLAALAWLALALRVRRLHPAHPVARLRSLAFLGGLLAIAAALMSGSRPTTQLCSRCTWSSTCCSSSWQRP